MDQHPPIQIVNERDEPIGGTSMQEAYSQGLIHRIVYVVAEDQEGNILLQKRSMNVANDKNRWDISVGGHVDEGEDYQEAAEREMQEELGLSDRQLTEIKRFYSEDTLVHNKHLKRFVRVYKTTIARDTSINFNHEEVTQVQWMSVAAIKQLIANDRASVASGLVECMKECYP